MLNLLHIENVAVIERADIEFGAGMNVFTGETGAGKSIIIDSINAILGDRVSKDLVRTGAANAVITAELTADNVPMAWFEDNDIEPDADGQIILMRKISADGKSSSRINGVPVSATQLRSLGEYLIDLHGQNDGQKLLREANHRAYLDGYAGLNGEVEAYRVQYGEYVDMKRKLEELREGEADKEYRLDMLRKKIREIESADPQEGEYDQLVERRDLLNNASKITDRLDGAYRALYGSDTSDGALSMMMEAEGELSTAGRFTDSVDELYKELSDLRYRVEDITDRIQGFLDDLDFSPGELERIEARLSTLNKLRKKYGSIDEMREILEQAKNELEDTEYLTENIEKLEGELWKKKKSVAAMAAAISDKRKKAAAVLEKQIVEELSGLNMPGVRFAAEILPKSNEDGFDGFGCDTVRFIMSANAGEEMGRISKIASGGELSRIMLAMKTVLSGAEDAQTMIFDEIDTGVSGRAAQKVAEKLAALSRGRQVLCVTHLPQLAVMADAQYLVEKGSDGERTFTKVTQLEGRARLEELARITGGSNVTETLLESAAEQIAAAEKFKAGL
ncbi:MAG: DNA repair protein RecN [Oscillospiraceae bacterium]|nr:DNA repair protein RecN [Oscillospiraceae bacterium]